MFYPLPSFLTFSPAVFNVAQNLIFFLNFCIGTGFLVESKAVQAKRNGNNISTNTKKQKVK